MISCIAVVGTTGSGKTCFALELAQKLTLLGYESVIINMDSRQVYKAIPILSAQPTLKEKENIFHYYYGYLDSHEDLSAYRHIDNVYTLCLTLQQQSIIPILVGGTGMYFHALFHGLAPIPSIPPDIRQKQKEKVTLSIESAYKELQHHDPIFAHKIQPTDKQRIIRGLEVYHATGKNLSSWHQYTQKNHFHHLSIGIYKHTTILAQDLYKRNVFMLEHGAKEEVSSLIPYYCMNYQIFSSIGFHEIMKYIQGTYSKEQCLEKWSTSTRQYAKRQRTWFRNKHTVHYWVEHTDFMSANFLIQKYLQHYHIY